MARFRRKGKASEPATDSVDLSDGDHAWWANGRVQHTPTFTPDEVDPPVEAPTPSSDAPWAFTDVFSADVDGAIDREFGATDPGKDPAGEPAADGRSLAEVFVEESAYRTLGLEPGASWDEVVLAHRRLAKRFHPDRLIHAEDHERFEGEQKMIEATAAYEPLRRLQRTPRPVTGFFTP